MAKFFILYAAVILAIGTATSNAQAASNTTAAPPAATTAAPPAATTAAPAAASTAAPVATQPSGVTKPTGVAQPTGVIPAVSTGPTPSGQTSVSTQTTTLDEKVSVTKELPIFDNCDQKSKCELERKALDAAIFVGHGICGEAVLVVKCLRENCKETNELKDSYSRIKDRCGGASIVQLTGVLLVLSFLAHFLH